MFVYAVNIGILAMTGTEFRELRKSMKLTQSTLAAALGCSRFHIGNLEGLVDVPKVYELALIKLAEGRQNEAA